MIDALTRRMEWLEEELETIKEASKQVQIKGLWKGVSIKDKDILEAKFALFKA